MRKSGSTRAVIILVCLLLVAGGMAIYAKWDSVRESKLAAITIGPFLGPQKSPTSVVENRFNSGAYTSIVTSSGATVVIPTDELAKAIAEGIGGSVEKKMELFVNLVDKENGQVTRLESRLTAQEKKTYELQKQIPATVAAITDEQLGRLDPHLDQIDRDIKALQAAQGF